MSAKKTGDLKDVRAKRVLIDLEMLCLLLRTFFVVWVRNCYWNELVKYNTNIGIF